MSENTEPTPAPEDGPKSPKPPRAEGAMSDALVAALKTCYDPEIPVDIYELGLIYEIGYDEGSKAARVEMTLTSPNCPAAQSLPAEVKEKCIGVEGVESAEVEVVWDPPWTQDLMTEAAKLALGMY